MLCTCGYNPYIAFRTPVPVPVPVPQITPPGLLQIVDACSRRFLSTCSLFEECLQVARGPEPPATTPSLGQIINSSSTDQLHTIYRSFSIDDLDISGQKDRSLICTICMI